MEINLRMLLRAPEIGVAPKVLYPQALDIAAWADDVGFNAIDVSEHHGSMTNYNPSSLLTCGAMASCTKQITLRTAILIAPLYDYVKLAEDAAMVQLFSRGRFVLGLGAGYLPREYEMFEKDFDRRWHAIPEVVKFLRQAWTGNPFKHNGKFIRVTPAPDPHPLIALGGASVAAAKRAAHIADAWIPPAPELWQPYREECIKLGKTDPGPQKKSGPLFTWISKTPEKTWEMLRPYVFDQELEYRSYTPEQKEWPTLEETVPDEAYRVLTPEQAIDLGESLGADGSLSFLPMISGIAPEKYWEMLSLFEKDVLPYLPS
jgi:alkanesulfonate monooxygenase SsuD/methylene tetrahydromethanopterin reductase-like flavin-dependent oxidoreductase (luciferase family)